MAGLLSWLRPTVKVTLTVNRLELGEDAVEQHRRALGPAQQAQLEEVLRKVAELPTTPPQTLALEAVLSRYVPRAPMASNVKMMDSAAWWKRVACVEEARVHVDGLIAAARVIPVATEKTDVSAAAALMRNAKRICWLVGAGVSVAAGIPVEDAKAQRARSMDFYLRHSDVAWVYADALKRNALARQPTPAHRAMVSLSTGKATSVVTLNTDMLEQRVGLKAQHLLGALGGFYCLREEAPKEKWDPRYNDERFPICVDCGGLLKPGTVFFGEAIPVTALDDATRAIADAALLVEVGTTPAVTPVGDFHRFARKRRLKIITVQAAGTTSLEADVQLVGDCQSILQALSKEV